MNLKERGITVGDLLILLIIIVTTTIFLKTFNKDTKTSINHRIQEGNLMGKNSYQYFI